MGIRDVGLHAEGKKRFVPLLTRVGMDLSLNDGLTREQLTQH